MVCLNNLFGTFIIMNVLTNNSLPDYAIEISGLNKTYKGTSVQPAKEALLDINLKIPRGSFLVCSVQTVLENQPLLI